ncbi:hypothetical protein BT93_I0238 [Corymbia citriodora subsp. variegata]|nr:hypothetical protein BT93_I0238 [Corymbia citriodora subsp. variegata]
MTYWTSTSLLPMPSSQSLPGLRSFIMGRLMLVSEFPIQTLVPGSTLTWPSSLKEKFQWFLLKTLRTSFPYARMAAGPVEMNLVAEAKKAASILESYLKRRGVALPVGNLPHLVVLPNPKFCSLNFLLSEYRPPPEVITYLKWAQLKPESKGMLSRWLKGAFCGAKKETQEPMHQQLSFVLGTAPMWDRLELNGDKYVLGEFLEFKGKEEDIQVLRNIRRSKIDRLIIQKTSIFGLGCYLSYESAAPLRLQVSYSPRDYRSEGASSSEWKELTVRSSTEILFQPADSRKVRKVKLSTVVSMTLSA